jgi:hypothetical protein
MPRIKKVPQISFKRTAGSGNKVLTLMSPAKVAVMKKLANAASKKAKKVLSTAEGKSAGAGVIHTGKLKVPFKPASAAQVALAKKGLLKQLKRR